MTPRSLHSCHPPAEPPRCLGLTVAPYWIWDSRSILFGIDVHHTPMRQNNALLITLYSLPRGTSSDLTDPLPSRTSTWSIRAPERAPSLELLHQLDQSLWNTVPLHIRRTDFALDAAGFDPTALDALSTTLTTFADVFSSSKLDYGECSLRPFGIKILPGTQPI